MKQAQFLNSDYIIFEDGRCYSNKSHKFLTPQMSLKYPTYNLTLNGKSKKIKVHRMVAIAFIPNPENKPYVNHIDGDTHNFNVSNLEWATAKENSLHAHETGLAINNDQTPIYLKDSIIIGEHWKPIDGYSTYLISDHGRILNQQTKTLKKTPLDNNGYPHAALYKNNKGKTFQVHRLEYKAFYPEQDLTNKVINHIDGDKTNNLLSNLECVTYQENNYHAEYITKTHHSSKAILMLDKDGNVIDEFPSIAEAQRKTGFTNISRNIKKGYSTKGYYWKFKN